MAISEGFFVLGLPSSFLPGEVQAPVFLSPLCKTEVLARPFFDKVAGSGKYRWVRLCSISESAGPDTNYQPDYKVNPIRDEEGLE